jgi:hypothetical protein
METNVRFANLRRLKRELGRARDWLAANLPARRAASARNEKLRVQCLRFLDDESRREPVLPAMFDRVLIDGIWDNANHWQRYALLRRAAGLSGAVEIGVLGPFSRARSAAAFDAFGIGERKDMALAAADIRKRRPDAERLLATVRDPQEILAWKLPDELPASIFYDAILKRQRRATVWLADPDLPDLVAEGLATYERAAEVVESAAPDLLVISHISNFNFGALVWAALTRGVRTVLLHGDYGVLRCMNLREPADIFRFPLRPSGDDAAALDAATRANLARAGKTYLEGRLGGKTQDVSAIYAFSRRQAVAERSVIAAGYGWPIDRPILAVLAPNWFDYPHSMGGLAYRDFAEWVSVLIEAAKSRPDVSWLFKAHPCDDWYGRINGPVLADLIQGLPDNIRLADSSWNGSDILRAIDGVLTVHGTAGIEASFLGKAVLVPYGGWYGSAGFAQAAPTIEVYAQELRRDWWRRDDGVARAASAEIFAGWYFCVPSWHGTYKFKDDAFQDAIWPGTVGFFEEYRAQIEREIDELGAWLRSGHRYSHIFKMRRAASFVAPLAAADEDVVLRDPRQLQTV